MIIYDKLVYDLQSDDSVEFSGEILNPSHFRIHTNQHSYQSIIKKIKQFQFSFLTINKDKSSNIIEVFFQSESGEYKYTLSVIVYPEEDNSLNKVSIRPVFKEAKSIELYYNALEN